MASDLYKKKMDRLFRSMDMTDDGYLDKTDFNAVATAMAARSSKPEDGGQFTEATETFWEMVVGMDGDGDGRITSSEFTDAMDKGMRDDDRFDEVMTTIGDVWFNLFDSDGDGGITLAEYVSGMIAHQSEATDHQKGFEVLDADGDGVVSKAEWFTWLKEYCTTDDPAAPGNLVLGPLPD